jgi:hypothetical protein
VCCCLVFETPNPEIPNVSSFLFRNSGIVVCWMFGYENHETLNPEILKCGSHLSFFTFQNFIYIDVEHWNSRSSEPRNPEKQVCTFPFLHFRSLFMLMFGHRNSRSSEPRNPKVRDPPFHFRISEVCICCCLGHLHSRNPELEIPKC